MQFNYTANVKFKRTIVKQITKYADTSKVCDYKNFKTKITYQVNFFQVLAELEETELREEREKAAKENKNEEDNQFALDIIRPGI